jgi:hypothetical protein
MAGPPKRPQHPRNGRFPSKLRAGAAYILAQAASELPDGATEEQLIHHWLHHPEEAVGMALEVAWKHPQPSAPPLPQAVVDHLQAEEAAESERRLADVVPQGMGEKAGRRL